MLLAAAVPHSPGLLLYLSQGCLYAAADGALIDVSVPKSRLRWAVRIRRVPPMTSADRQPPPGSLPFRSGVTRLASRTATITPPSAMLLAASGETG